MKTTAILLVGSVILIGAGCAIHQGEANRSVLPGPLYAAASPRGSIPAGATLVLRTTERIDTNQAILGTTYSATVDQPVISDRGNEVIPAGSPAQLAVVDSTSGGTLKTAQLELAVRSITVNGTTYNVVNDGEQQRSERPGLETNRRTAETVSSGAVVLGTAVGEAEGPSAAVATKGDHVRVPSETLLTFRLDSPIRLEGFDH